MTRYSFAMYHNRISGKSIALVTSEAFIISLMDGKDPRSQFKISPFSRCELETHIEVFLCTSVGQKVFRVNPTGLFLDAGMSRLLKMLSITSPRTVKVGETMKSMKPEKRKNVFNTTNNMTQVNRPRN